MIPGHYQNQIRILNDYSITESKPNQTLYLLKYFFNTFVNELGAIVLYLANIVEYS